MQPWEREQKERIISEHPYCYICGVRRSTQLHHAIVHDMKRYHRELTVPENLMWTCDVCHVSTEQTANSHELSVQFAKDQIRAGYDVTGWYSNLPLKVKEQWIYNLEV